MSQFNNILTNMADAYARGVERFTVTPSESSPGSFVVCAVINAATVEPLALAGEEEAALELSGLLNDARALFDVKVTREEAAFDAGAPDEMLTLLHVIVAHICHGAQAFHVGAELNPKAREANMALVTIPCEHQPPHVLYKTPLEKGESARTIMRFRAMAQAMAALYESSVDSDAELPEGARA